MSQTRIERLIKLLVSSNLNAIALNAGPSLLYLTGLHFHLSERPVVGIFTVDQPPLIILPELEILKLKDLSYEVQPFPYGENPVEWGGVFQKALLSLHLSGAKIGVEPRSMRLLEYSYLQSAGGTSNFPDASHLVSSLRLQKDAQEVACIKKAVKIAQAALEATLPSIKIGKMERDLASELALQLLRQGSDPEMPFFPIVSGGSNSANPHASPTDRKLKEGDLLVVDWGASFGGYISDLTRTFAVGKVDEEYKKIHQIVMDANAAGRLAVMPGDPCSVVDFAARQVIEKTGYGEYFTHRTGHGIGMEVHEDPYMRGDNGQVMEPGMTFTIEPGIYLSDRNGVRIEDNVLVTTSGGECLSDMPRELRVVG
jgi:Xaa-Pro dipeptidase